MLRLRLSLDGEAGSPCAKLAAGFAGKSLQSGLYIFNAKPL
jgi:hypothetical protein